MFGIVRRKKPFIHAHWYLPLREFQSDTEAFYKAIEEEIVTREIPEVTVERIEFRQRGWLSAKRTYLRLLRERVVMDICSSPFGVGWYFSLRAAELPRRIGPWQFWISVFGFAGICASNVQLFGLALGGTVVGASFLFLILVFIAGRSWGTLDEALIYLPFIGQIYEALFRRDTYQQQDHRLVYAEMVTSIVRAKVDEFCIAGGAEDAELIQVNSPDQILTEKEMVKFGYKTAPKAKS